MSEEEFKKEMLETIQAGLESFVESHTKSHTKTYGLREIGRNPLQKALEELTIRLKNGGNDE